MALQSIVNDLETRCFKLQDQNCDLKMALKSSKDDCEEKLCSLVDLKKELDSNRNAQELILEEIESKNSEKIKSLKKSIKDRERTIKNLKARLEPGVDNATQTVMEDSPDPQHSDHDSATRSEATGGQLTATNNEDEPSVSLKDRDEAVKSKIVVENKISDGTVANSDGRDVNCNQDKHGTKALCPQLENGPIRGIKTTKKQDRCSNATKIKIPPPAVDAFKKETSNDQPSDDVVYYLFMHESWEYGYRRICNFGECRRKKGYKSRGSLVESVKEEHPLELQHRFDKWQLKNEMSKKN